MFTESNGHLSSPSPLHQMRKTSAADVNFAPVDGRKNAEPTSWLESRRSSLGRTSSSTSDPPTGNNQNSPKDTSSNGFGSLARRMKKSGGFLLESAIINGRPKSPQESQRGGKRRSGESDAKAATDQRLSAQHLGTPLSPRSSPLSNELSHQGSSLSAETESSKDGSSKNSDMTRVPAIDPAQLVQMALSLSESRKRGGLQAIHVPASVQNGKRIISSGVDSGYGTVRTPQRSVAGSEPRTLRTPDSRQSRYQESELADVKERDDQTSYTFSAATLSRAEKARKYFELASEHRRLLEHLPPLKRDTARTDTKMSDNRPMQGKSKASSVKEGPEETQKIGSGRDYNPLQALRNRRLRNRERRPLTAPPDIWQETDRIRRWIDDLAAGSVGTDNSHGGHVAIPQYEGETDGEQLRPETAKGHRRTTTNQTTVTHPDSGWSIEPAELLADTYWVEKGDNKNIIEDRHGQRLFPAATRRSPTSSRPSQEVNYARTVQSDGIVEEEMSDERSHPRIKHILHIPDRLRRPHLQRTTSNTSNSSTEGRKPPPLQFDNIEGGRDENIGPLERQMRDLIAKDERGELSSPEKPQSDHWDSRNTQSPMRRHHHGRLSRDLHHAREHLITDRDNQRRDFPSRGVTSSIDYGMTSMDEVVSDSPASPTYPGFPPSISIDSSPPGSRWASPINNVARGGARPDSRPQSRDHDISAHVRLNSAISPSLSPIMSNDDSLIPDGRLNVPARRPSFRRHKTADSVGSGSMRRWASSMTGTTEDVDTTTKDVDTTSNRKLFRGGRIGDIVRNESSRIGDRFRGHRSRPSAVDVSESRNVSDVSLSEEDSPHNRAGAVLHADEPGNATSPRSSLEDGHPKGKYHIPNLPSFKSPTARDRRETSAPTLLDPDPISRQQSAMRKRGRSPRFDRLAPPHIRLPSDESVPQASGQRKDVSDRIYGSQSARTSLAELRGASYMSTASQHGRRFAIGEIPEGQRHWSITDRQARKDSQAHVRISARDVARVRALVLASGIKAREILRQANIVRKPQPAMLRDAVALAGKDAKAAEEAASAPRKQESLVATQLLATVVTGDLDKFDATIRVFHTETMADLERRLASLQRRAADQLTSLVHETSDDADAFNVELTTKQPQDVKRVDEAVDALVRQRRRQFRWVRRTGFKALELVLLTIMWWVWFIVMVVNTFKRSVVLVWRMVKWLVIP